MVHPSWWAGIVRPGVLAVGMAAVLQGCASSGLDVAAIGNYYVGGHEARLSGLPKTSISTSAGMAPFPYDPNGEFETGQMYVNYTRLSHPKARYPMLMWHGGGMSGVTWQTKPDGKPGWEQYFLGAGYDVYISDSVERGRSGWSQFPQIYASAPIFRAKKEFWELFRIGPMGSYKNSGDKTAYPDSQFPVSDFDVAAMQSTPRWLTNDGITQQAYDEYVQKACPCILVAHSQGTSFAVQAALKAPDKIKALVLVEASSSPDPAKVPVAAMASVPTLYLWGDHIADDPLWPRFQSVSRKFYEALSKVDRNAEWLELPSLGIHGNGHLMMMDRNSDQIAGIIDGWLASKGMKR
ncbi:MAG TPA: alpha/beta fold hydrolase [Bordetella sp.]